MKKIRLVFAAALFFNFMFGYAQSPIYESPNILPPSPTASALGKYGLVPVSMSTGTPNIEIPLYVLKTKNLTVPISLSYHSNGVKVDEIASWVGLGWSLNCGGVISRIVRDDPDELSYSSYLPYPENFSTTNYEALNFIEKAGNNDAADMEPDLFTFNFAGYSGKFIFDKRGVPMMMPHNNLRVERYIIPSAGGYFIITTPDGVKFTFGATETSSSRTMINEKYYPEEVETAWYLTGIEHPQGDKIIFTYDISTYSYASGITQSVKRLISGELCGSNFNCPTDGSTTTEVNTLDVRGLRLSKIEAINYGSIDFHSSAERTDLGDYQLNSLEVKDTQGEEIKEFSFDYIFSTGYDYTHTYNMAEELKHRMFLSKVIERDKFGQQQKAHELVYNDINGLPPRLAYAQDHWGYFNGVRNSWFVPENNVTRDYLGNFAFYGTGGDREPDFSSTQKGILEKIIYPTGGFSEFTYEANSYYGSTRIYPDATTIQLTANGNEGDPPITNSEIISSPYNHVIDYTFSVSLLPNYPNQDVKGQINIRDLTNGAFLLSLELDIGMNHTDYFELIANHEYEFEVVALGTPVSAFLYFDYHETAPAEVLDNIEAGGIRISKIVNHDPATGKDEEINYFYARHDQLNQSSGKVSDMPVYYTRYFTRNDCIEEDNCITYDCTFGIQHSSNKNSLFQLNGSDVNYQYVTVSRGDGMHVGFEEHEFLIKYDTPAQQVWGNNLIKDVPLTNTGWENGKEKGVKYFKTVGENVVLLKETYNSYVKDERNYQEVPSLVIRKKYDPICKEDAIFDCDASNIEMKITVNQCVTNHEHSFRSTINGTVCMRWFGGDMETVTIGFHPCYGKTEGETALVPYALDYLDAIEYKNISYWTYLDKTIDITYDENGTNPVESVTRYFYDNESHIQLSRVTSTTSDGKQYEISTKYPDDYDSIGNDVIKSLRKQHIVNAPIKQESTLDGNQTAGDVILYNSKGQPEEVYKYESAALKTPVAHDPTMPIPSSDYALKEQINYYSLSNNLRDIHKTDNFNTIYLWGYNNTLPIAEVKNAEFGETATNLDITNELEATITENAILDVDLAPAFEVFSNQSIDPSIVVTIIGSNGPPTPFLSAILKKSDGTIIRSHNCTWGTNSVSSISLTPGVYQWYYNAIVDAGSGFDGYELDISTDYIGQRMGANAFYTSFEEDGTDNPEARTGHKIWSGLYEINLPGQNGDYLLTYWQKTGSGPWILTRQTVTVTSGQVETMNIGASGSIIDEVRLHPPEAVMTTYTYDPQIGVTSVSDANQITTYYEYDDFGRLGLVRDQERNILKSYSYHYYNE